MTVFPLIRLVRLKAATASSRTATLPMFVRSRPSRTRCTTSLNWARSASTTKRTASGVEMSPGEMQIDRRLLQVAMPEQHLSGAQVGTGFEQMRGKAVAQRVGMNVPVFKPSALCGVPTGSPQDLGGDRITCGMPSVAGKQPVRWLVPEPAPIDTQRIEQLRAEHDIAVLATFAAPDMDDHPLAVDIADLQVC